MASLRIKREYTEEKKEDTILHFLLARGILAMHYLRLFPGAILRFWTFYDRWNDTAGYSSGQRGQTVNLMAMPSKVRILPPPPSFALRPLALSYGW